MTLPVQRALPARANLENLKKQAKQRLSELHTSNPDAKLSEVQFQLAREYGYPSWRALKASIQPSMDLARNIIGNWIADENSFARLALLVRSDARGKLSASIDVPDLGYFGDEVEIEADAQRLCWTVVKRNPGRPSVDAVFEATWDEDAARWSGTYRQAGRSFPLSLQRGVYPPAPTISGMDGLWDGMLVGEGGTPLTFGIRTDEHGTQAWCDSPRKSGFGLPASSIELADDLLVIRMRTCSFVGQVDTSRRRIQGEFRKGDMTLPLSLSRRPRGAHCLT